MSAIHVPKMMPHIPCGGADPPDLQVAGKHWQLGKCIVWPEKVGWWGGAVATASPVCRMFCCVVNRAIPTWDAFLPPWKLQGS